MDIAFIGHGRVGGALALGWRAAGHRVVVGTDAPDSASLRDLLGRDPSITSAPVGEAIGAADVVVLAVPYPATGEIVAAHADALSGKVLIDCTNPVGPGLSHGLESRTSGSETIQMLAPGAKVVKAFSIYGAENFADNRFADGGEPPAMFFCGDDDAAKAAAAELIAELGWRPFDVGGLAQALHLEHMTLLWVRMVRMGGHTPHLAWAVLER